MQTFCENQWVSVIDTESIIASQLVLVDTGQLDTRYRRAQVTRVIRLVKASGNLEIIKFRSSR